MGRFRIRWGRRQRDQEIRPSHGEPNIAVSTPPTRHALRSRPVRQRVRFSALRVARFLPFYARVPDDAVAHAVSVFARMSLSVRLDTKPSMTIGNLL